MNLENKSLRDSYIKILHQMNTLLMLEKIRLYVNSRNLRSRNIGQLLFMLRYSIITINALYFSLP